MSQVTRETIPDNPISIGGVSRSLLVLFEYVKGSGVHYVSHALVAVTWYIFMSMPQGGTVICLSGEHMDTPGPALRSLLHLDSFYRQVLFSIILLILGSCVESRLGAAHFLSALMGNAIIIGVIARIAWPDICFPGNESLGPVLVSLCVLLHGNNPKIATDAYSRSLRTAFVVEPRWFAWFVMGMFTLFESSRDALYLYGIGLAAGALPWGSVAVKYVYDNQTNPKILLKIFRAIELLVSLAVLPFSVTSLDDLPFSGPTIMFDRNLVVADWFSLVCIHLLTISPIFLLLDSKQRVMPFVVVLSILAWIYCSQSPYFVYPGPGLLGLGLVVYSAFWLD